MNIVWEGLPGSGKTTVSSKIAESYNGIVLPEFCDNIQGEFGDIEYFVNNEKMKNEIIKSGKNGKVYCLDRFWHSTLVANAVYCGVQTPEELLQLFHIIYKGYSFEEYIYIFLDIPSKLSLSRNENTKENLKCMWFDKVFNEKAYFMYQLLYENLEQFTEQRVWKLKLDAQKLDQHEVIRQVQNFLNTCETV